MYRPDLTPPAYSKSDIINFQDYHAYIRQQPGNRTGAALWKPLMHLSMYAAHVKLASVFPSTDRRIEPFMLRKVFRGKEHVEDEFVLESVLPTSFDKTFILEDRLRFAMLPTTHIAQYGMRPKAYDPVRSYLAHLLNQNAPLLLEQGHTDSQPAHLERTQE